MKHLTLFKHKAINIFENSQEVFDCLQLLHVAIYPIVVSVGTVPDFCPRSKLEVSRIYILVYSWSLQPFSPNYDLAFHTTYV